jgi:hypothetical protein
LRKYWATHRNPCWAFPAEGRGHKQAATADKPMSESSVQNVIKAVLRLTGLERHKKIALMAFTASSNMMQQNLSGYQSLSHHRLRVNQKQRSLESTAKQTPKKNPPQPARYTTSIRSLPLDFLNGGLNVG